MDCSEDEECLKWNHFQPSGFCYKPKCSGSSDCPPGMMCNLKDNICMKSLCNKGITDNCCRFHCKKGEYIPNKCTSDYECGYKVCK